MSWFVIIVLILVGLLFVILEVLIVPGLIMGLIGVSLLVLGIYESFVVYGSSAGYLTILGTFILALFAVIIIFRSKTWHKLMLHTENTGKVNVIEENKINVGDRGKTVSKLSVGGKALINGEYYEVHSTGDYIDSGSEIEVVKVDAKKILVKKV